MNVKVLIRFRDLEADKIREPNEQFSVSKERGDKLKRLGFVEETETQKTEKKPKEAAK